VLYQRRLESDPLERGRRCNRYSRLTRTARMSCQPATRLLRRQRQKPIRSISMHSCQRQFIKILLVLLTVSAEPEEAHST
jgi:hypothetical protein